MGERVSKELVEEWDLEESLALTILAVSDSVTLYFKIL